MAAIASRYARAFAEVVWEKKLDAPKCIADLREVEATLQGSVALGNLWQNPAVPEEQKFKVLDAIVAQMKTARELRNFIAVLISHHRLDFLSDIRAAFEHELNEALGIAEASVVTARPLQEHERHLLEAQIAAATGKRIRAQYAQDATMLGGAWVRVDSTIYDGSVKGQLQRLKEQLVEG
jgi:F-type H+-transporting ATPase subunit delta